MKNDEPFPFDDFIDAKNALCEALEKRARYIVITGESGSGKTSLLRVLRRELDRCRFRIVYFNLSRLSPAGLIRVLARHLRTSPLRSQPETIQAIAKLLIDDPCHTMLWVDEAQQIPDETFMELRTLAECDLDGASPVSVLWSGLPELRERLMAPRHTSTWRRIRHRIEITGLRRDELVDFSMHHLGQQATERFHQDAMTVIFEHGRGVPGLVLPYLERVLAEADEGPVAAPVAEAILQRWDLV